MKLVIQLPCFNEAETLAETLLALPRRIAGVDEIEFLVIDDGSHDGTSEVARLWGVHHIVRHRKNRGLAAAYQTGIDAAIKAGADIIVNTDADNQYDGRDIPALVAPILEGQADIVIGDRQVRTNRHFGRGKQLLQVLGSMVVQRLSHTDLTDAVSGFRAMSRAASTSPLAAPRLSIGGSAAARLARFARVVAAASATDVARRSISPERSRSAISASRRASSERLTPAKSERSAATSRATLPSLRRWLRCC